MQSKTSKTVILVVDDDFFTRQFLIKQLTRAGYEVLGAHDGHEALNWLHQGTLRPDLVMLDLFMPRYSGLEVLSSIRTLSYRLPVILMSAADPRLAQEGIDRAAPDLFLSKPFTQKDLLTSIQETLVVPEPVEQRAA